MSSSFEIGRLYSISHYLDDITKRHAAPIPRRHAVDDLDLFVAGEAEVDEPLAVEQPSSLLQQHNTPSVVLDQFVVGGEDGCPRFLLR